MIVDALFWRDVSLSDVLCFLYRAECGCALHEQHQNMPRGATEYTNKLMTFDGSSVSSVTAPWRTSPTSLLLLLLLFQLLLLVSLLSLHRQHSTANPNKSVASNWHHSIFCSVRVVPTGVGHRPSVH